MKNCHDEHAGRVGHQGDDHSRIGVVDPELHQYQVLGDQQYHGRHRHDPDEQRGQPGPASKVQPRQGVSRQRVKETRPRSRTA